MLSKHIGDNAHTSFSGQKKIPPFTSDLNIKCLPRSLVRVPSSVRICIIPGYSQVYYLRSDARKRANRANSVPYPQAAVSVRVARLTCPLFFRGNICSPAAHPFKPRALSLYSLLSYVYFKCSLSPFQPFVPPPRTLLPKPTRSHMLAHMAGWKARKRERDKQEVSAARRRLSIPQRQEVTLLSLSSPLPHHPVPSASCIVAAVRRRLRRLAANCLSGRDAAADGRLFG